MRPNGFGWETVASIILPQSQPKHGWLFRPDSHNTHLATIWIIAVGTDIIFLKQIDEHFYLTLEQIMALGVLATIWTIII